MQDKVQKVCTGSRMRLAILFHDLSDSNEPSSICIWCLQHEYIMVKNIVFCAFAIDKTHSSFIANFPVFLT